MRILKQAMRTPGVAAQTREQARRLIDYLCRWDYTEFGELLG